MTNKRRSFSAVLGFIVLNTGCAGGRDVHVQLETHRPQVYDGRQVEVQAMVLGPQTALHYKWFSVNGDFDPQESYEPKTQFTFAPNSVRDRIWVEVWRDYERVAESALDVNVDTHLRSANEKAPAPELTITRIPRYQPEGGPDTRDTIGGAVRTPVAGDYRVVVYARADAWYIQPTPFSMQPIEGDNTWRTWTHTGSSYAAIVVRKTYKPLTRLDVLPQIDADVLARVIVEGRK
jgi:hypothetical protein